MAAAMRNVFCSVLVLATGLSGHAIAQAPLADTITEAQARALLLTAAHRIGHALAPFCAPKAFANAGALVLTLSKDPSHRVQAFAVVEGGPAYLAGLRNRDTVLSVNGRVVVAQTQLELMQQVWRPAVNAALDGPPMALRIRTEGADAQEREISIKPVPTCYGGVAHLKARELDEELRVAGTVGLDPSTVMIFLQARTSGFAAVEANSYGHSLKSVGQVLNLFAAITGKPTSDTLRDVTPYMQADHLRADFVAMLALLRAGQALDKYLDYLGQNPALHGTEMGVKRQNVSYSTDQLNLLKEVMQLVVAREFGAAAQKVSFSLPPGLATPPAAMAGVSNVPVAPSAMEASVSAPVAPAPAVATAVPAVEEKRVPAHAQPVPLPSGFAPDTSPQFLPRKLGDKSFSIYERWLKAPAPKAVAISGRGAIGTGRGFNAMQDALALCNQHGAVCALYAVDDHVVWDPSSEAALAAAAYRRKLELPAPDATGFAALDDIEAVPRLSAKGRELYREWLDKPFPRAVAISEKGAIARGYGDVGVAKALENCERFKSPCRLYAVNDKVVFVPFAPK
ncbi:PDZ domain-containing protein [Polaromonas sp. A23]|uniref:PDZ domain-containing protein n=1 Tax=Polaromonas sp. A23 TaxID=1944133 RepID=UPI0009869E14|nr:PDZ domain-containing protein [Polaromonas sp. A23]OOG43930.1 hypothetical protein B0B52_08460 [Polaromonas sp. A23]